MPGGSPRAATAVTPSLQAVPSRLSPIRPAAANRLARAVAASVPASTPDAGLASGSLASPAVPPWSLRRPNPAGVRLAVVRPGDGDFAAALAVAIGPPGRRADAQAIEAFLRYTRDRGGAVLGAAVLRRHGRDDVAWSAVATQNPGGIASLQLPETAPSRREVADKVPEAIVAALDLVRTRGLRHAQVLLPDDGKATHRACEAAGFEGLTRLIYLHKRAAARPAVRDVPDGYRLETYAPETHDRFERAIERSYLGSLDSPELNGLRPMSEVIEGHKAAAVFEPGRWFLLSREADGEPAGVMLLGGLGMTGRDGVEIVYVGLSPEARGQGLADVLLDRAELAASRLATRWLAVAVDERNVPALRVYGRRGSLPAMARLAMLCRLG